MAVNKRESKQLLGLYEQLSGESRQSLVDFAEFLLSRQQPSLENTGPIEPEYIPPRQGETVIQAIKRLSASYHMLDKGKLLNDTSALMTEHTLQGRDRDEVIEELEVVFKQHYQRYLEEGK
jgi:hypothetical protein